jgi:GTP 3',8-cyclase
MDKVSNVAKGEKISLFTSIAIETAALCNRHCHFCPNDYYKRPNDLMSTEMFRKIIDDLEKLKYRGRVELYIYNEPTRDLRLPHLIANVRNVLPGSCIMISTNGDYFKSADDIQRYFDAGLNQMQINIYSANDSSTNEKTFDNGIAKAKWRQELIQGWVDEVGVDGSLSLYQNIGPKKQACKVIAKYGIRKEATSKDVEGVNHFSNRSGNVPDFHGALAEPLKKHCVRPFRFLNINWKGDALLCCNDYYGKLTFGNVGTTRLEDIWNNVELHKYRLKLQNKQRNMELCDVCDFNGGYYPHMINKVTFGTKLDQKLLAT